MAGYNDYNEGNRLSNNIILSRFLSRYFLGTLNFLICVAYLVRLSVPLRALIAVYIAILLFTIIPS